VAYDYVVLGAAGQQGQAICDHLLRSKDTGTVVGIDLDRDVLSSLEGRLKDPRFVATKGNIRNMRKIRGLLKGSDVVVASVSYQFNYELAKAAMEAGAHFCDLGGNDSIVRKQYTLHDEAVMRKVRIMPDTGIAPGAVSILTMYGIGMLGIELPEEVKIRVGGLPQDPEGFLKYMEVFSMEGLINEYDEPVRILRGGEVRVVEPLSEIETLRFPEPFGMMEAAFTSGGASTLIDRFKGEDIDLDYKTIRYPGHFYKMRVLRRLGFFSTEPVRLRGGLVPAKFSAKLVERYEKDTCHELSGNEEHVLRMMGFLSEDRRDYDRSAISPRELTKMLLDDHISYQGEDALLLKVDIKTGLKRKYRHGVELALIDRFDPKTGHSAMQRTTGYSSAIIAQMLARGHVKGSAYGVLAQEDFISPEKFVRAWKRRGIELLVRLYRTDPEGEPGNRLPK
jgi:lysine 6-dehydrogenase